MKITAQEFARQRDKTEIEGEKACYCGHTDLCDCGDPDINTMKANSKKTLVANIPTLSSDKI